MQWHSEFRIPNSELSTSPFPPFSLSPFLPFSSPFSPSPFLPSPHLDIAALSVYHHPREQRAPVLLLIAAAAFAAVGAAAERPDIAITVLEQAPVIDGVIGEAEWSGVSILDEHFIQVVPEFGQPSPFRTVIRVAQTESAVYVAVESFDPDISRLAAAATNRDGDIDSDDSITVMLDTFSNQRTAYAFGANPLATQWDGSIADNGAHRRHAVGRGLGVRRLSSRRSLDPGVRNTVQHPQIQRESIGPGA